jgi:cellulose synthase operon protein C
MKRITIGIIIGVLFFSSFSFAYDNSKEDELLYLAKKAYEDGFYEVSLGMLERLQKDYRFSTKLTQVSLLRGQCYFHQGRYLEALSIFESLVNDPEAGNLRDAVYFWMAEVHFKGNNFEKAAGFYQKIVDDFPQSSYAPEAYYSLGWSLAQIGKYSQALQTLNSLLEKFPNEPQSKDAAFKIIEYLYNLKGYAELKNKIKPIFKLYANDPLRLPYLYFYLAESEYYLDNLDEAAKNYLKSAQASKEEKVQALAKLGLGWSYLKLMKYKEAEDVFADIKQSSVDKKSLDILVLGQAMLMSATNRVYEAKKLYDQLINISHDSLILIQAYLGKADALYNLAEYAQAINVYQEGLAKIEKATDLASVPSELIDKLHYNLGLAYIKQGQIKSGVDVFEGIISKSKDRAAKISLLFQIAEAYEDVGEFLKAEKVYRKILEIYPDSDYADYAQYQIGSVQLKSSDYNKAIVSLKLMLKNYPQSKFLGDAVYCLGSAYFQKADYAASCEIFARFQNEFKDNLLRPQALYMLGTSFLSLGKANDALSVFSGILKLDFQDTELLQKVEYEIADCYFKLGQEDEAVSRFKSLRTKYPDSKLTPEIMWWLGQYYYRQNDFNLARRYFSSLAQDFPNSSLTAEAFYALGLTFSDEHKFEQAADSFRTAVKLGNSDLKTQAAIALGDIYDQEDRPEEALAQYKEIIKDSPDLGNLLLSRIAQAYYKVGDYEKAKIFYSQSLEAADNKDVAGIRFKLAEVLEAKSEFDAAIQQYLTIADLYAQAPQLFGRSLLRAAKLYEDKENFKEALNIYKRIIQKGAPEEKFAQERIDWIKGSGR